MALVTDNFQRAGGHLLRFAQRIPGLLGGLMPKGLYARALIIIIAPIVLLESVVAFVFMERHWESVTRRLSKATAGEISAIIDVYDLHKGDENHQALAEMARKRLGLSLQILPETNLPATRPKPFFDLLDRTLSKEIRRTVNRPFWIDTVGASRHVEIRIKLDDAVLRFVVRRSQTYASNSHIFLAWMVGSSLVLLTVAILFLSNQIKPILRLADAADQFGKGRQVPADFRPRGAREVRLAAHAFLEMRDRIEKHVEQRTTMLAGVSHDLRTILTRFNLQLAMLGDSSEIDALRSDVGEMQVMLSDYVSFTKGDTGEESAPTDIREMLEEIRTDSDHLGVSITLEFKRRKPIIIPLRRHAFKRSIANLVNNAARFADHVTVSAHINRQWLWITVDDDGPGIPKNEREDVFRPFYRLDVARNQDEGNTGLGLSIARDIARSHGGDIWLDKSKMGGLRATVRIPV